VRVPASALIRSGDTWALYAVKDGRARRRAVEVEADPLVPRQRRDALHLFVVEQLPAKPAHRGLDREGADLGRTIMCHVERTIADPAVLLELAATGVRLEYDLFGLETSYYPYNPAFDMPNDGERMRQILFLIERGHLDQILMSHDIAYKHCLTRWGGFGYHHLLVNVIPRLRAKGADDKIVQTLLIDNPRRAFAYA